MLRLLAALCLAALTSTALAAEKTFRKEVRQIVGSSQSQDDARQAAIAKARRDALEEAGTWVQSVSEVKNMKLVRDDVMAISMGITRTRIIDEAPFLEGRAVGIRVLAEVSVDTAGLAERVQRYLADQERLMEKRAESAREAELLAKLAELERRMAAMQADAQARLAAAADAQRAANRDKQLAELEKSAAAMPAKPPAVIPAAVAAPPPKPPAAPVTVPQPIQVAKDKDDGAAQKEEALRREIQENSRKLAAQEAFRKGESYSAEPGRGNRYTDPQAAIAAFSEAVRLDPGYADAYSHRGRAHTDLKEYSLALEDINRALGLDPNIKLAHVARAKTRLEMGDNKLAVEDATEGIRRLPDMAAPYTIRGRALNLLGEYQKAMADYEQAIRLDPNFAIAYAGRAGVKFNLGDRFGARADTTRACDLGFQPSCDRLRSRGTGR
jgi:tetratricopeptide (TPR) repeat protein